MTIDFKGKLAVITGGSSGIGKATAESMLRAGSKVAVVDISPTSEDFLATWKDNAFYFQADVSLSASVENVFLQIEKRLGKIDILINNAGIQSYGSITQLSEETWDRTINVNLKSIFLCSKYAIPLMLKCSSPVIINVASVKSFVCQANEAAYVASKSAIIGLTRSIATDYAPKLRCVAVCPGAVHTPMLENELNKAANGKALLSETENIHLLKRIAAPDEIASFILFLASEHASFATGHAYRVDGGIGVQIEGT